MKKEIIAFNKIGLVLCGAVLSLLLLSQPVYARSITVGPDVGDDYSTISAALTAADTANNNADPNDDVNIIYVKPGTYAGNITMVEGVDLLGAKKETTIIRGYVVGVSNTTFEGFKVAPTSPATTPLYTATGKTNVKIKDCIFYVSSTSTSSPYTGIALPSVAGAEVHNNSIRIKSTTAGVNLIGINFSGSGVSCTYNSLSLEGTSSVKGIEYTTDTGEEVIPHVIANNAIKTKGPSAANAISVTGDPLNINYNLLLGNVDDDIGVLIGNLLGVDPVFDGETTGALTLKNTSPAKGAADPVYDGLYAMGVTDIGVYDSMVVKKDIKEIQQMIDEAEAGDTIYLRPGEYALGSPATIHRILQCGTQRQIWNSDLIVNKNLTLKAIDPNPSNTVINCGSQGISIMDTTYYYGSRYYLSGYYSYTGPGGFETLNNVTLDGLTIRGISRGSEFIKVLVRYYTWVNGPYGRYRQLNSYWSAFTSGGIKAPIYNFSKNLTLKNCNIEATNRDNISIYTTFDTTVNLEGTTGTIEQETDSRYARFSCPYYTY